MKRMIISIVLNMAIQGFIFLAIHFIRANEDFLASWAITAAISVSFGLSAHLKKNYNQ